MSQHQTWRGAAAICVVGGRTVLDALARPRCAVCPCTRSTRLKLDSLARYGEGRILISACTSTESAWEQPGTGHGLLTYAVIDAMTGAASDKVSFPAIADDIITMARVEGQRIGVTQSPVFLGSVEGGLVFPRLTRGDNFLAAFPSTAVEQMSGAFAELGSHGFPQPLIDQWTARFPKHQPATTAQSARRPHVSLGHRSANMQTSRGKESAGEQSPESCGISTRPVEFGD